MFDGAQSKTLGFLDQIPSILSDLSPLPLLVSAYSVEDLLAVVVKEAPAMILVFPKLVGNREPQRNADTIARTVFVLPVPGGPCSRVMAESLLEYCRHTLLIATSCDSLYTLQKVDHIAFGTFVGQVNGSVVGLDNDEGKEVDSLPADNDGASIIMR